MLRLILSWSLRMFQPATVPSPAVGLLRPQRMRIAVVLPAPFAPRKPKISPLRTSKLMLSTAVKLPNFFVSPLTLMLYSSIAMRVS